MKHLLRILTSLDYAKGIVVGIAGISFSMVFIPPVIASTAKVDPIGRPNFLIIFGDLLAAWKLASRVPQHFASFHQGTSDGELYTEGFSSWGYGAGRARNFFEMNGFITRPVLATKRYINIADFVANNRVPEGVMSPLDLAAKPEQDTRKTLKLVTKLRDRGGVSPTFDCELTDIEAWSAYGNYFAGKLRGGVALARARTQGDTKQQDIAVAALEQALVHWKHLAELGGKFNQLPILSNSKAPFSWASLTPAVGEDIEIAKAPLVPIHSQ